MTVGLAARFAALAVIILNVFSLWLCDTTGSRTTGETQIHKKHWSRQRDQRAAVTDGPTKGSAAVPEPTELKVSLQGLSIAGGSVQAVVKKWQSRNRAKPSSKSSSSTPTSASSESVWNRCFQRGERLVSLSSPGASPLASPFQEQDVVGQYGWTADREPPAGQLPAGAHVALQALGLATDLDTNIYVDWAHNTTYRDGDDDEQPATGAFYREYYNPSQGVIVGTDNASPTYAAKGDTPIPELGCWSDLVWLEWAQQCAAAGTDPGALQYVVRDHIVTGETLVVVEHVLTRLGKAFDPPWDQRVEVPVCTEGLVTPEGTALLGTPHGYGVGYLLTQHRASIRKRVGSITIFATKPNAFSPWQTHMLFNLVDLAG